MFIDSHCHLVHKNYEISLEQILSEAVENGIDKFITIGTSVRENIIAIKTAESVKDVYCSVGIYPHEDRGIEIDGLRDSLMENFGKSKKIVAIGECGIDISNWEGGRSLDEQLGLFEMQLELAKDLDLPIIIHNRNGDEEVYKLLKKYSDLNVSGVMHCFTSDWNYAQKILDLGFYISFTNMITYPKKNTLLEVVKNVPTNRFLLETDAPYLPPQSLRGKINYPKYVRIVAEKVAQVKQKTLVEVGRCSYENTCKLFKI
jgi:TatD DNase family protein